MANDSTLQEAAGWHARMHAADCTDEDRAAFEQWLLLDAAHGKAYALAQRTSVQLDQLASSDLRLRALARLAREEPQVVRRAARWKIPAALAASVAVAVLTLHFVPDGASGDANSIVYESTTGTRTVTLDDGSTVQLDVATRLTVSMRPDRRQIHLLAGRAVFDVAHDRSRPFSVMAADSRTTALGTRFQVELAPEQVVVTLEHGSVAIDEESDAAWHEQLLPGEQLSVPARGSTRSKSTVDPGMVTSWTRGRHLFRSTPLSDAVADINRYASKKVRLGDPSLGNLMVGGNFIAGDSEQIVAALAAALPLSVVNDGHTEIILFRRHDPQY
jgi:transmembrane sensor